MDITAVRLTAPATRTAPALLLRPWRAADVAGLVAAYQDDALRRWTVAGPRDEVSAMRWVREQRRLWETADQYAFAVVEPGDQRADGELVGHVVLKRGASDAASAEVGYWTAAHARGRGVAPRALETLTDWAFTAFADHELTHLDLLHQVDNTASCRVAHKCGYGFTSLLPAAPPAFPLDAHRHVRVRDADEPPEPGDPRAGVR
ncbi:GNAT family N-acetyltransferase [Streptomyces sp. NPDC050619]|uniref:GNAT family N-acetyltransferase n=1 Tax=Streptomyces sp. NPDC050619 TaxID=3157214 RepID=UPI0034201BD6